MSDDEEDFVAASEDAGAFVMLTHPPPGLVYAVEKATGRMFWARRGESASRNGNCWTATTRSLQRRPQARRRCRREADQEATRDAIGGPSVVLR